MTAIATAVEQVLVVPTLLFHEVGYFQGFNPDSERYLKTLLDPAYTSYRPRDTMEQDPSFKQIIPYCVFRCGDQIFRIAETKVRANRGCSASDRSALAGTSVRLMRTPEGRRTSKACDAKLRKKSSWRPAIDIAVSG